MYNQTWNAYRMLLDAYRRVLRNMHACNQMALLGAAAVVGTAVMAVPARAADPIVFDGGGNGMDWTDAENWDTDVVPVVGDAVSIGAELGAVINPDETGYATSVDVALDGSLGVASDSEQGWVGGLELSSFTEEVFLRNGGKTRFETLYGTGTSSYLSLFTDTDDVEFGNGAVAGVTIENTADLSGTSGLYLYETEVEMGVAGAAGGDVSILNSGGMYLNNTSIDSANVGPATGLGDVLISNTGIGWFPDEEVGGGLVLTNGSSIDLDTAEGNATLDNDGDMQVNQDASVTLNTSLGDATLDNTGNLQVRSGGSIDISTSEGAVLLSNGGDLLVRSGANINMDAELGNATLDNTGNLEVYWGGAVSVGTSEGDAALNNKGNLQVYSGGDVYLYADIGNANLDNRASISVDNNATLNVNAHTGDVDILNTSGIVVSDSSSLNATAGFEGGAGDLTMTNIGEIRVIGSSSVDLNAYTDDVIGGNLTVDNTRKIILDGDSSFSAYGEITATLTNMANGTIEVWNDSSVAVAGEAALLVNAGTITGDNAEIRTRAYDGDVRTSTIDNTGLIDLGDSSLVRANSGGGDPGSSSTIDNSGTIVQGDYSNVQANVWWGIGDALVDNSGSITQDSESGVRAYVSDEGTATLLNSGSITQGYDGSVEAYAYGDSEAGAVSILDNSGTIVQGDSGYVAAGGDYTGLDVDLNIRTNTLTNSGTITQGNDSSVEAYAGDDGSEGNATLNNSGTITQGASGYIEAEGVTAIVNNALGGVMRVGDDSEVRARAYDGTGRTATIDNAGLIDMGYNGLIRANSGGGDPSLSTVDNSGTIVQGDDSDVQANIWWGSGDALVENSRSITQGDDSEVVAHTNDGAATIDNSGTLTQGASGYIEADGVTALMTNALDGVIRVGDDSEVRARAYDGTERTATIDNAGLIDMGYNGLIRANSGGGDPSLSTVDNSGTIVQGDDSDVQANIWWGSGDALVENSGSMTQGDDSEVRAYANDGTATLTNSSGGTITQAVSGDINATTDYGAATVDNGGAIVQGDDGVIQAYSYYSGDTLLDNSGSIVAGESAYVASYSYDDDDDYGDALMLNSGSIVLGANSQIQVYSQYYAAALVNSDGGTITLGANSSVDVEGYGQYLEETETVWGSLLNSGTLAFTDSDVTADYGIFNSGVIHGSGSIFAGDSETSWLVNDGTIVGGDSEDSVLLVGASGSIGGIGIFDGYMEFGSNIWGGEDMFGDAGTALQINGHATMDNVWIGGQTDLNGHVYGDWDVDSGDTVVRLTSASTLHRDVYWYGSGFENGVIDVDGELRIEGGALQVTNAGLPLVVGAAHAGDGFTIASEDGGIIADATGTQLTDGANPFSEVALPYAGALLGWQVEYVAGDSAVEATLVAITSANDGFSGLNTNGSSVGNALGDLAQKVENGDPVTAEELALYQLYVDARQTLGGGQEMNDLAPDASDYQKVLLTETAAARTDMLHRRMQSGANGNSMAMGQSERATALADNPIAALAADGSNSWSAFALIGGSQTDRVDNGATVGYSSDAYQLLVGLDKHLANGWQVGGALGYDSVNADANGGGGSETTGFSLMVFGEKQLRNGWYVGGVLGGTSFSYETTRTGGFAGDTDGMQFSLEARGGKRLALNKKWDLDASAGLQWVSSSVDGYTESGGLGALTFSDVNADVALARLGARFIYNAELSKGWGLRAYVEPSLRVTLMDDEDTMSVKFNGTNVGFTTQLLDNQDVVYGAQVGAEFVKAGNLTLEAAVVYEQGSDSGDHTLGGFIKARVNF